MMQNDLNLEDVIYQKGTNLEITALEKVLMSHELQFTNFFKY